MSAPQTVGGFYSWYVGTLRDGRITTQVPLENYTWSDVMDDAGALSGDLILSDPEVAALQPRVTAEPCRCFLAVAYTDLSGTETFLAGGPIWTHAWDETAKKLTLGAAGIWSLFDHRFVLPVLAMGVDPSTIGTYTVNYAAQWLGTIAKGLVELAQSHTGGDVPIVLQDDETGTDTRGYPASSMTAVGQALRDLTTVAGGPEIQFVPQRRDDDPRFIQWVMRTGTTAQPLLSQTGNDWVWDTTVQQSAVSGITLTRDGSSMAERVWVQGSGSDTTTLFAQAEDDTLIAVGFPLLEVNAPQQSTITAQPTLDTFANGQLAGSQSPVETWNIKVRRDGDPRRTASGAVKNAAPAAGAYSVGDWAVLRVANSPYLLSGDQRVRITGISGDTTGDVALQAQTELVAS